MSRIELSDEQKKLKEIIEKSKNHIFVTGKAGTGKSTLLREITQPGAFKSKFAVVSFTGIAARHIGGATIHSTFDIHKDHTPTDLLHPRPDAIAALRGIDVLVIDEVSMVSSDLLDAVDKSFRLAKANLKPFGGTQIIMFGDFCQLAPIGKKGAFKKYMQQHYKSLYAFDSLVWEKAIYVKYELQHVFRQEDEDYKQLLNRVREGTFTTADIDLLNTRVIEPPDDGTVTLCTTNDTVDYINRRELEKLPGEEFVFHSNVEDNFPENSYPADSPLMLKEGAPIVMVKNDINPIRRWHNGSRGTVHSLSPTSINVQLENNIHSLNVETWENIKFKHDVKKDIIIKEVKGTFAQYPIKLAWAMTIHKAQGQTLEKVVIDLGSGAFSPGQTYVALSRCTSLEGVYLTRPIRTEDIIVHPRVTEFMKSVDNPRG